MHTKHLLCTVFLTFATAATAYGATYTAQTITIFSETSSDSSIDVTDTKIITDDFSFKVPEGWAGCSVVVQGENTLELYNKTSYDTDGSGLLFTIVTYDNSDYQDLTDYSILGFCGNSTYILMNDYISTYQDSASSEYQACKDAVKTLKKSFVSFIKEQ